MDQQRTISHEEAMEIAEHQQMISAIQTVVQTKAGKDFVKYLLKSFDIGELPAVGTSGDFLMDRLGFLRAGQSVFKMIAEASPDIAGQIIAQIEKERYAQLLLEASSRTRS